MIMVLFHMARHFSEGSGGGPAMRVLTSVERDALGLAMKWATARGQSTERLHAALAAYREMPKVPSATDILRGEANIVENTFDLPANKFRDGVQALLDRGGLPAERPWAQTAFSYWTLTPWERNRGRRVNRMISADAIRQASIEPAQRPELVISGSADSDLRSAWDTTPPLTKGLFWNWIPPVRADDLNEVGRRALVQILAIRAWQLKHDGQFPERLEALVPEELATLPNDPYSGHPFGFVRNEGRRTLPLRSALGESNGFALERALVDSPPGSRLLYSVGPLYGDRSKELIDRESAPFVFLNGEIVFVIPPVEQTSPPQKDKAAPPKIDRPQPVPNSISPGSRVDFRQAGYHDGAALNTKRAHTRLVVQECRIAVALEVAWRQVLPGFEDRFPDAVSFALCRAVLWWRGRPACPRA